MRDVSIRFLTPPVHLLSFGNGVSQPMLNSSSRFSQTDFASLNDSITAVATSLFSLTYLLRKRAIIGSVIIWSQGVPTDVLAPMANQSSLQVAAWQLHI